MKVLLVLLLGCACVMALAQPMIPALTWTERSDWTNVKTDITPAAVGDGLADDTAALQKALDSVTDGTVLYLPPGTYRITNTLVFKPTRRLLGIWIVGHGRDTKLVWDGEAGKPMLLDYQATNSRFMGFLMDGRSKATVGLYHAAGSFETEVGHRHLAFLNFTDAGILTDKNPATAEVMIENSLFENCKRGIAFLAFNDYDYTIDGCEFRRCDIAVQCSHGNTYVRNTHFEGSTTADLDLNPEHGSSVRRCTSLGSKTFLIYRNPVAPLTVQDCRVEGWTNTEGAALIGGAPVAMFDCVFTKPPDKTPPVKLRRNGQRFVVSGNVSKETGGVIQPGNQEQVFEIPSGKRSGNLTSAGQSFLQDTVAVPTKVFDAKVDFGAKGDWNTDDTDAIQKTIDAARAHGKGAIAYLPTGVYRVTRPLQVTGKDYSIGGTGFRSGLLWQGPDGGNIIEVTDPDHITIEQLSVGNHDIALPMTNAIDILQTSTGKPSFITYDDVSVYGMYQRDPFRKGLWLKGLSKNSTVLVRHAQGNIHLVDAAQATVLLANSYEGSVVIEGKDKRRDGMIGILTRLGTSCTYALFVKDNHSLIASDFYIEQADNGYNFAGGADDPPGRITIQEPKMQMNVEKGKDNLAFNIANYGGQLFVGPLQWYCDPPVMKLAQTGQRPLEIVFWANSFYSTKLDAKTETAKIALIGCAAISAKLEGEQLDEQSTADTLRHLAVALDDLRLLGETDLRLNHPDVKLAPARK